MGHVSCDRRHVTRAGCRWGTDYLLKCHVSEHELYGQVGSPELYCTALYCTVLYCTGH